MSAAVASRPVLDPRHAPPFPEAALPVLRNAQLRKNVAHAIDVIQAKRARLVAEKTDWQELRSAASAIRAHALENLDAYLEAIRSALHRRRGHRPLGRGCGRSARIILDILREENATEVIKIKTMTSAEIQLNPVLEAAGISVFETDLAEIILQLGDDEPSHIVVPALHVNRSQVREIFARRMGLPESVRRSAGADRCGAHLSAPEISQGTHGHQRRQFSDRRNRLRRHRRVGRQRPHVPHPAAHHDHACRH